MKKWQEERNYRRVRNEGGEVIANKTRCKKKEVTEELKIQFCEMAQQYKKVMTPDMRKKISERYNK